jgi:shikimate kinase
MSDAATVHGPGMLRKVAAARARPVALVGFMGAGKTTVGAALSAALGWPFVDSDAALADRFGPIAAQLADPERFRAREEALIHELAEGAARVLATGGGGVLRPGARAVLAASYRVFWLDAPLAVLAARDTSGRPLWDDRVAERLYERRPLYEAVGERIDADAPPHVVVAGILARLAEPG